MGGGTGSSTVGDFPDLIISLPTTTNSQNSHAHNLSSSSSRPNLSYSANYTSIGTGNRKATAFHYDNVFASVPSPIEVEKAIYDLRRLMLAHFPCDSELDQHQQMLYPYDPHILHSIECRRILKALHMLQSESPVQKMVSSISSDKAVWDAILNNKAIQELCGSLCRAKEERPQSSDKELDFVNLILKWILDTIKARVTEVIEALGSFVNEISHQAGKENHTSELFELLEEKVRSSLMLSIVILLIVVVTRIQDSSL